MFRRRRRLKLPDPIIDLKGKSELSFMKLADHDLTYQVIWRQGTYKNAKRKADQVCVQDRELLASSQIGWTTRRRMADLAAMKFDPSMYAVSASYEGADSVTIATDRDNRSAKLHLDKNWKESQADSFFGPMLRQLNSSVKLKKGRRDLMVNAARLIGRSCMTANLAQAFLWNMIAIETLLISHNDTAKDAFPKRMQAIAPMRRNWTDAEGKRIVGDLYQKRCKLVHEGFADTVQPEDVYLTDAILYNCMLNIINNPETLTCQNAVARFADYLAADQLAKEEKFFKTTKRSWALINVAQESW